MSEEDEKPPVEFNLATDKPVLEGRQTWFPGMVAIGWGCLNCRHQVVAEWTKDDKFTFHCKCAFVEPLRHGKLGPIQFHGGP